MEFDSGKMELAGLNILFAAATDLGKERAENQDEFDTVPEKHLFVLSDGMGGHEGGKEAAQATVTEITTRITEQYDKLKKLKT